MDLNWLQRPWVGYVAASLMVAVPGLMAWLLGSSLGRGFDALILAVLVGVSARAWGTGPGLLSALISYFVLGLLSTPVLFNLHPDTPAEWIEAAVYVGATVFLVFQVGSLRDREVAAILAQREAAAVSRLTAALVPDAMLEDVGEEVVSSVSELTRASSVSLLLPDDHGELTSVMQVAVPGTALDVAVGRIVRHVWENDVAVGLPETGQAETETGRWPDSVRASEVTHSSRRRRDVALPLESSEGRAEGVLYVGPRIDGLAYDAATASRLVLAARLVAVFLDRHRLQEETARAEAATEAEKLRASMISSVSHELKTPLASINATVTGLLDEPEPAQRASDPRARLHRGGRGAAQPLHQRPAGPLAAGDGGVAARQGLARPRRTSSGPSSGTCASGTARASSWTSRRSRSSRTSTSCRSRGPSTTWSRTPWPTPRRTRGWSSRSPVRTPARSSPSPTAAPAFPSPNGPACSRSSIAVRHRRRSRTARDWVCPSRWRSPRGTGAASTWSPLVRLGHASC